MSSSDEKADEDVKPAVIGAIVSEARLLKLSHVREAKAYAKNTIRGTLDAHQRFLVEQEGTDGSPSSTGRTSTAALPASSDSDEDIVVVPALRQNYSTAPGKALEQICAPLDNGIPATVQLPRVQKLPKYDCWVPVIQNLYVEESDIDPYIPYFGDNDEDLQRASAVHDEMIEDVEDEKLKIDTSDVELDENGILRGVKETWHFSGREQLLRRAAERHTILSITRRHGTRPHVWAALSTALRIGEVRRLEFIRDLAEKRETEMLKRNAEKEAARKSSLHIQTAIAAPKEEGNLQLRSQQSAAAGALKCFCFVCQKFACLLHKEENVPPVLPIPDRATERRMVELANGRGKLKPCSDTCFLLGNSRQTPSDDHEERPWTAEQLSILREGVSMYQRDPCNLAALIGSRQCRDVHLKISCTDEEGWIDRAVALSKLPRISKTYPSTRAASNASDGDDDAPVRRKRRSLPKRAHRGALKSANAPENDEEPREQGATWFTPCRHAGTCSKKNNCSCAQNDLECQVFCGCNAGRYVAGRNGMYWQKPTDEEVQKGVAAKCSRRTKGCKCKDGTCHTDACECYENRRACNPDMCEHCGCSSLPTNASLREQSCRNSGMITGRHKRTYVGRSRVQGYGLFAGEHFASGELVGAYSGRLMETSLLDKSLRVSNAQHETFAFEVADSKTIDGGTIGSKVKFINHTVEKGQNCLARCERVRGEARIALKTCKAVKPGEEFLFDYKLKEAQGKKWAWAVSDSASASDDESRDEEEGKKGYDKASMSSED